MAFAHIGAARRALPAAALAFLVACSGSDAELTRAVVGTWASREVAPDDVIVETQFSLLPGGRVNWSGQLRMLVPPDFSLPDRPNFEVANGRLVYNFTASGNWSVRDGYLHTKIETSTLPSLMPVGFASAWRLREVTGREMIYVSAASGRTRVEMRVRL
ncbi:MAG TPA: hypothetical protein VFV71_00110 [Burkholderiales bacterium]|nr:hypothetical protein [Burkholderiales bacterium]